MSDRISSRRTFVKSLAMGTAASAAFAICGSRAADPDRLDPSDPKARALGYVENARAVDAKKYPAFVPGSNCENCLQLQGAPGNNYRPCTLFPGKLVAVAGWCSGWTPEI